MIREVNLTQRTDAGFAYGASACNIPAGYNSHLNMYRRVDGSWWPRFTPKWQHATACAGNITDVHIHNVDDMLCFASNGNFYKKNVNDAAWSAVTWAGGGDAPTVGDEGYWCDIGDWTIYSAHNGSAWKTYKIYNNDGSWDYLTGDDIEFGGPITEHANQLLIGGADSNIIRYSDAGDYESGVEDGGNYVACGSSLDGIQHLFYNQGTLFVIKEKSIWAKSSTFAELDDQSFNPVYYEDTNIGAGGKRLAVMGNGVIYFANSYGIFSLQGGNITKISTPFDLLWQAYSDWDDTILGYWDAMDWLICCVTSSFTLVFDVKQQKWYYHNGYNFVGHANSTSTYAAFVSAITSTKLLSWNDKVYAGTGSGQVEETFSQKWKTGWDNCDAPGVDKYLRRIRLNATNVTTMNVYLETTFAHQTDPSEATYTVSTPGDVSNFAPTSPFERIVVELVGTGSMVVARDGVVAEIDDRRRS